MARTDADKVKDILQSNYGSQDEGQTLPSLTRYITAANLIVTQLKAYALARITPVTLDDATLLEIETWLAAHFYCVMDPIYVSKSTQGASASFQRGPQQDGFESTDYGRAACQIDTSGTLRAIGRRQVAGFAWLGTPVDDQKRAEDR